MLTILTYLTFNKDATITVRNYPCRANSGCGPIVQCSGNGFQKIGGGAHLCLFPPALIPWRQWPGNSGSRGDRCPTKIALWRCMERNELNTEHRCCFPNFADAPEPISGGIPHAFLTIEM